MTRLPVYALLAISTLISVTSLKAGPSGEEELYVDRIPEERYERSDRYWREDLYEREERYDHHDWRDHPVRYTERSRTVYIIVDDRPVRRVVYLAPRGGYYRIVGGRRVAVRERYFTSYPSRYFYPDGRRRVGVRFSY